MDIRNIVWGDEIPTESYCDQPYIVKTDDGAWLCILTTGKGNEGEPGQHIVSMRSKDHGKTWRDITDIEPADGPEASYATALKTPDGRIYCFYNHNTDNIREVKADPQYYPGGYCKRVDSLGHFVFKYSDDNGLTWSEDRFDIPQRTMDIDRENPYGGKIKFFWNVGKPFTCNNAAYVPLHKVGGFGKNFFTRTEGVLLKSCNLLTEKAASKIEWETLPHGDFGLRAPNGGGLIAEEHNFAVISDGGFFCVFRTVDGHAACAYSGDGGKTWSESEYMAYADGRSMKHPRAANFVWKLNNGKYLYWFHNHGGNDCRGRNPVWICGGVERKTTLGNRITWTQPEILLYDDDPYIGMSYPDFIVEDEGIYYTETNKSTARVHRIDGGILDLLWQQFDDAALSVLKPVLSLDLPENQGMAYAKMPNLPNFSDLDYSRIDYARKDLRQGFSIEITAEVRSEIKEGILADTLDEGGSGISIKTTRNGTIEIMLSDGVTKNLWECDEGLLRKGRHHIVITVDGGPKIVTYVIDGALCDGGSIRQYGWGRFSPNLRHANGRNEIKIYSREDLKIEKILFYEKALKTSEAVIKYKRMCENNGC